MILCTHHPAIERWRYIVTLSLIGWAHTQNDPCPYHLRTWDNIILNGWQDHVSVDTYYIWHRIMSDPGVVCLDWWTDFTSFHPINVCIFVQWGDFGSHDDIIKWKPFPCYWPFVRGIHHRTKASDTELWCFLWSAPELSGWVNNREAGDLRCHHAHYVISVMMDTKKISCCQQNILLIIDIFFFILGETILFLGLMFWDHLTTDLVQLQIMWKHCHYKIYLGIPLKNNYNEKI